MPFNPNKIALPETPENVRLYQKGYVAQATRLDGTTFIGRVVAVDRGKPGGAMLVTFEDANAQTT